MKKLVMGTHLVLAAEVLGQAEPFLREDNVHPTVLVSAYTKALAAALEIIEQQAMTVDVIADKEWMKKLVQSSLSTKFSGRWNDKMVEMALQAVLTVAQTVSSNGSLSTTSLQTTTTTAPAIQTMEVDLKRYAKIEKIPGGEMEDCEVLRGVMFNKDTVHSSMRRRIENPRILLLDTPLEYKKGESQTNMEITQEQDWSALLKMEEEYVAKICQEIIHVKPDIVITEKGFVIWHNIIWPRRTLLPFDGYGKQITIVLLVRLVLQLLVGQMKFKIWILD